MTIVRGFGLTIASAITVRGAAASRPADGPPHVTIEATAHPDWAAAVVDEPYRARSVDLFDVTVPGVARYTCIGRDRILVDAAADADSGHVADLLIATALPALLWARGGVVLHAAAALFPGADAAVAVAGDSGAGKSTWLAAAVAAGASVVADDALHLRVEAGRVIAAGLPGGYFERYGSGADDRTFRPVPPSRRCDERPLGAIRILTDAAAPHPLAGAAAVAALLRHRHRPRVARLLRLEAAALATVAGIARAVPVSEISRGTSR